MKIKMRDEDRRAMDLLLDRSVAAAGKSNGSALYAATDGRVRERVSKVEKILQLLEAMPAAEPPKDLVRKTLRYVEHAGHGRGSAAHRALPPLLQSQPPVA